MSRRFGLLFALALYLALTLYQLTLPGPNYDEAVEAKAAVQALRGLPVEVHRDAALDLFGRRLPLMIVDYVGALNTYALALLFKLGGIGVVTMRLWPILVGAVVLWLGYRLAYLLSGPRAAFLAALLLAVQPSFVFFMRQGIYVTNTTIAFMLAIWLALVRLAQSGDRRWWYAVAFLAGLGLWAKFIMLWPLLATAALAPFVWWGRRQVELVPAPGFSPRQLVQPRALGLALVAFLLGLGPFILFNLQTGATFQHFLNTLGQSYYGVENSAYLGNLIQRWAQIGHFLSGDHFWYLGGNFSDPFARPAWLLGFALILLILIWRRQDRRQRALAWRALIFYALFLLLFVQTPLTPTALWYTHLALFSPVLALGTGLALDLLARQFPRPRALILTGAVALLLVGSGLRVDLNYHRALTATGGYADHSDAVYRLADALLAGGMFNPYALDWGFDAPLILISQGQVNPIEVFGYDRFDAPDEAFPDRLRPLLQEPGTVFLLHAPDRTNFPGRREALEALAQGEGVTLETVAVIRERSGAPHTELIRPLP